MEPTNARPQAPPKDGTPGKPFATGTKKVERIAQQSMELIDDLKDWIELKIKLTELEIQEKFVGVAALGIIGALAVVFLCITLALGLGAWLGHPAWGFLIVTVLLLLVAGILYQVYFGRKQDAANDHTVQGEPEHKALAAPPDGKTLPPSTPRPEPNKVLPGA